MAVKPALNETELISRTANGDERAFTDLFYWYAKPLSQFVHQLTNSVELTEEVIQNSFVKVWLRRETLLGIQNFGGYVYTITRNEAIGTLKKMANRAASHQAFEKEFIKELELPEENEIIEEYRKLIELAVDKLPTQQQKVYRMSRYQRLKHDEIATQLNLSSETVKKHIQLAVKFIQNDVSGNINNSLVLVLTSAIFFK